VRPCAWKAGWPAKSARAPSSYSAWAARTRRNRRARWRKKSLIFETFGETFGGTPGIAINAATQKLALERTEKANRSLLEIGAAALVVSQFTLYGDARNGRRPSYMEAAPADLARQLYEEFVAALRALGVTVATGVFQAHMEVELVGDGPVTLLLDTDKTF
jgi:D-tyrosyl-tRNA(Tyr) deacylase